MGTATGRQLARAQWRASGSDSCKGRSRKGTVALDHHCAEASQGLAQGSWHRSSWIDARRAAEEYWERWLQEAALRPDVMRLASRSVVKERERKSRAERAGEKSLVSSGAPEGCGG